MLVCHTDDILCVVEVGTIGLGPIRLADGDEVGSKSSYGMLPYLCNQSIGKSSYHEVP